MAEGGAAAPNAELLEFPKKDNRSFLHVVYRVGDLDRTIKFYTECLGMKLLRKRTFPRRNILMHSLGLAQRRPTFLWNLHTTTELIIMILVPGLDILQLLHLMFIKWLKTSEPGVVPSLGNLVL